MLTVTHCLALALATLSLVSCKDSASSTAAATVSNKSPLATEASAKKIASNAYQHTEKILSFGHRQPESAGLKKSKDYVIAQLKRSNWSCIEQRFTAKTPKGLVEYSNLIARYAPNSNNPWRRSVKGVLGAHIDSKILPNFLGADDAASCVAAILAIANHLDQTAPHAAQQLELVLFDGEEAIRSSMTTRDGLYGSIHYSRMVQAATAQQAVPYKKTPEFGVVLDMIGHHNLDIKIPADTPKMLARSYFAAVKKLGHEKHFGKSRGSFLDDHYPMNVIAKIPTIDIIGDFSSNKWWHTSADSIDLISEESLSMSIQVALEIISNQL